MLLGKKVTLLPENNIAPAKTGVFFWEGRLAGFPSQATEVIMQIMDVKDARDIPAPILNRSGIPSISKPSFFFGEAVRNHVDLSSFLLAF